MQYDEDSDGKISRSEYCLDPFMDLNAGIRKLNKCVILILFCHLETYIYAREGPFVNKNIKSQTTVKNTFESITTDQKTG
jgi:hypothetical protein